MQLPVPSPSQCAANEPLSYLYSYTQLLRMGCKIMVSPMVFASILYILLGLGVLEEFPDPDMTLFTPFWNDFLGIPILTWQPFFLFIGLVKAYGMVALINHDSKFGVFLLLVPTVCAWFMLHQLGLSFLPPMILTMPLLLLLLFPVKEKNKEKSD